MKEAINDFFVFVFNFSTPYSAAAVIEAAVTVDWVAKKQM